MYSEMEPMDDRPGIAELAARILFCIPLILVMPFCIIVMLVEELLNGEEWR